MDKQQTSTGKSGSATASQAGTENQSSPRSFEQEKENVMDAASAMTSAVKDTAGQFASAAKGTVKDLAAEAQASATEIVEGAKSTAQTKVSEQRVQLASQLGSIANALRETSDRLKDEENPSVAQYTSMAADQLQSVAGYLQESDMSVILRDVGDFARRQPGVFLASTLTAGFLLGRFLKSSSPRPTMRRGNGGQNYGYDSQSYGSSYATANDQWSQGRFSGYASGQRGAEPGRAPQGASVQESWSPAGGSQVSQKPGGQGNTSVPQQGATWLPDASRTSALSGQPGSAQPRATASGTPNQGATEELVWRQNTTMAAPDQPSSSTEDRKASSVDDVAPHGSGPSEEFQGE